LETLRLDACLARELPGLYREMRELKAQLDQDALPEPWARLAAVLARPDASVADSLRLLPEVYADATIPECCYQGELRPDEVAKVMAARLGREKMLLRVKLADLAEEAQKAQPAETQPADEKTEPPRFELAANEDEAQERTGFELTLDGAPIAPPDDVRDLLTSIQLDLGQIPDDYLVAAGPGEYDPSLYGPQEKDPNDVWQGTYHEEGATLYPEWDYGR
jgi:nitric oxide reductase NorD protein